MRFWNSSESPCESVVNFTFYTERVYARMTVHDLSPPRNSTQLGTTAGAAAAAVGPGALMVR
jgi:hypothetical protein